LGIILRRPTRCIYDEGLACASCWGTLGYDGIVRSSSDVQRPFQNATCMKSASLAEQRNIFHFPTHARHAKALGRHIVGGPDRYAILQCYIYVNYVVTYVWETPTKSGISVQAGHLGQFIRALEGNNSPGPKNRIVTSRRLRTHSLGKQGAMWRRSTSG
jgi:hypothetical protein